MRARSTPCVAKPCTPRCSRASPCPRRSRPAGRGASRRRAGPRLPRRAPRTTSSRGGSAAPRTRRSTAVLASGAASGTSADGPGSCVRPEPRPRLRDPRGERRTSPARGRRSRARPVWTSSRLFSLASVPGSRACSAFSGSARPGARSPATGPRGAGPSRDAIFFRRFPDARFRSGPLGARSPGPQGRARPFPFSIPSCDPLVAPSRRPLLLASRRSRASTRSSSGRDGASRETEERHPWRSSFSSASPSSARWATS